MSKLVITTKQLMIRNLRTEDLKLFHTYRSNPEIAKYQGFDVMNMDQCRTFIEEQKDQHFGKPGMWVQYGIENINTGELIGDCAIRIDQHNPPTAEIGITISHLQQKNGFAREAMQGIMTYLFEVKQVHRIVETVDTENTASIRLLESIGFRKEGHFIENIFFKGHWGSEFLYAMLRREWDERKATTEK